MKVIKSILPWFVTIVSLIIVFNNVSIKQILMTFNQVEIKTLLVGILASIIFTLYVCTYKYQAILDYLGYKINFAEVQRIKLGVLPAKVVLPFKSGEFFRAVYLKEKYGIPYTQGVYSIILGYLLRLIILGIFILCAVVLKKALLWLTVVILSAVILSVLFKHPKMVVYSILFELFLLFNYFIVFKSISVDIKLEEIFLYIPIILFIEGLPVSIYGVGVREGLMVTIFAQKFGIEKSLLSGLLASGLNSVIPSVISLFFVFPFVSTLVKKERVNNVAVVS